MNKYIIEYWKTGLPHKQVIRYAKNVHEIKFLDFIFSTAYKVLVWSHGIIVAEYTMNSNC